MATKRVDSAKVQAVVGAVGGQGWAATVRVGLAETRQGMLSGMLLLGVLLLGSAIADARPKPKPQEPVLLQQSASPDARLQPVGGVVTVQLVNNTYTAITYQAIGDTEERVLAARSTVTLQNLKTPTSMTFYRSDRGFLLVKPMAKAATIQLTMTASDDFSVDKTSMEIKSTGEVYLK
jgi:hypothetical protein